METPLASHLQRRCEAHLFLVLFKCASRGSHVLAYGAEMTSEITQTAVGG